MLVPIEVLLVLTLVSFGTVGAITIPLLSKKPLNPLGAGWFFCSAMTAVNIVVGVCAAIMFIGIMLVQ